MSVTTLWPEAFLLLFMLSVHRLDPLFHAIAAPGVDVKHRFGFGANLVFPLRSRTEEAAR